MKLLEVPFQCKGYVAARYTLIIIIHKWEQPSIYKGCFGKKRVGKGIRKRQVEQVVKQVDGKVIWTATDPKTKEKKVKTEG